MNKTMKLGFERWNTILGDRSRFVRQHSSSKNLLPSVDTARMQPWLWVLSAEIRFSVAEVACAVAFHLEKIDFRALNSCTESWLWVLNGVSGCDTILQGRSGLFGVQSIDEIPFPGAICRANGRYSNLIVSHSDTFHSLLHLVSLLLQTISCGFLSFGAVPLWSEYFSWMIIDFYEGTGC